MVTQYRACIFRGVALPARTPQESDIAYRVPTRRSRPLPAGATSRTFDRTGEPSHLCVTRTGFGQPVHRHAGRAHPLGHRRVPTQRAQRAAERSGSRMAVRGPVRHQVQHLRRPQPPPRRIRWRQHQVEPPIRPLHRRPARLPRARNQLLVRPSPRLDPRQTSKPRELDLVILECSDRCAV